MAWFSTAPAAITALVAAFQAIPDVAVYDGPTVNGSSAAKALTVGFTNDMMPSAVEGTMAVEGLAVAPERETYTVQCSAVVVNGSDDIAAARTAAYALLGAAGQALVLDKTLGGTVMLARVGAHTLMQSQTPDGAVAQVTFGVEIDAYSGR